MDFFSSHFTRGEGLVLKTFTRPSNGIKIFVKDRTGSISKKGLLLITVTLTGIGVAEHTWISVARLSLMLLLAIHNPLQPGPRAGFPVNFRTLKLHHPTKWHTAGVKGSSFPHLSPEQRGVEKGAGRLATRAGSRKSLHLQQVSSKTAGRQQHPPQGKPA